MADEPKWTPGPWAACKDGRCTCGLIWSVTDDHPVATVQETPWGDADYIAAPTDENPEAATRRFIEYGAFPKEQFHANARLIAAAPDMAEALDAVDRMLSEPRKYNATTVKAMVRAALAKARGEP